MPTVKELKALCVKLEIPPSKMRNAKKADLLLLCSNNLKIVKPPAPAPAPAHAPAAPLAFRGSRHRPLRFQFF